MNLNRAIMITVTCIGWKHPKTILMNAEGGYGQLIKDIAHNAFEKYKATQNNNDLILLDYCYYGDVEVLEDR
jgi:hypothetical protein